MRLDPSEGFVLRIAMSAHSLIYAPLYRAAAQINSHRSSFHIEFDYGEKDRGFGDEGAYRIVGSVNGADMCICDPMVVVNDVKLRERCDTPEESPGVIVGLLVHRPALWLICLEGSELAASLHAGGADVENSVAFRASKRIKTSLGRVLRYKEGSSAYYYLRAMINDGIFECVHETDICMGDEKPYLILEEVPGSHTTGPDVVMTCEFLEAYKYKEVVMERNKRNPLIFAWHRQAKPTPFTAVVANRDMLRASPERKKAVVELLSEIEYALRFISNSQVSQEYVNAFLTRGGTIQSEERVDPWEHTLTRVQTSGFSIFPGSVRPDSVDWSAWKRACDTWGISSALSNEELKKIVTKSIDYGLSRVAAPHGVRDRVTAAVHHCLWEVEPNDTLVAAIFSPTLIAALSFLLLALRAADVGPSWLDPTQVPPGLESLMVLIITGGVVSFRVWRRRRRLHGSKKRL